MFNPKNIIGLIISLNLLPLTSFAQNDSINIYEFNLLELSKLEISSVSKIPQNFSDISATAHVITAEEIRDNGYFTLNEVLSSLPGFQFRDILGFNSYVFQRGVPSQNNLILLLIDGIQVNELNSGGFYGGGQYNLENIEKIEVVYGPASVVYGTNAISGVINLITKETAGIGVSILGGSFNTYNVNLNYGYKKEAFDIRVSGMYKTTEKADLRGAEGDNNWTEDMENFETDYSFDAKIRYKNIKTGVNVLNKTTSRTTSQPSIGTNYQERGSLWDILFVNAYLKHNYSISKHFNLSTSIYNRNATVRDNTITYTLDTTQVGFYRPNHLIGGESVLSYTSYNKLKLVGGVMFESAQLAEGFSTTYSNSFDQKPPKPSKPNLLTNNLLSAFIEGDFKIVPSLSVVGGLRFDNSSVYEQVFTPRFSILFNREKMTMKLLYANAFRAPKPWDYTNGIGNPNLLPEKMNSLELSNNLYLSKSFSITTSIYKNILDESIEKELLPNSNQFRWINKGRLETDGAEITLKYSSKKIRFSTNYTFNHSYNENKVIIPEIAKHMTNATITYRFFDLYRINLSANYIGERKNTQIISATNSDLVEPALIFNGTLSLIDFHKFNLQLMFKNILNKEYYHTSNVPVERYRQPQRTLMIKLAYNL